MKQNKGFRMNLQKLKKVIDSAREKCYNYFRWLRHGEMAERFKALVLKTSDTERYRGFESLSLRQLFFTEEQGHRTVHHGEVPKWPKGLPC